MCDKKVDNLHTKYIKTKYIKTKCIKAKKITAQCISAVNVDISGNLTGNTATFTNIRILGDIYVEGNIKVNGDIEKRCTDPLECGCEGCVDTVDTWIAAYPDGWPAEYPLTLGNVDYTKEQLYAILTTVSDDATYIVIKQLIALELNISVNKAAPSDATKSVATDADLWLVDNPLGSNPVDPAKQVGLDYAAVLTEYNTGLLENRACGGDPQYCKMLCPLCTVDPDPNPDPDPVDLCSCDPHALSFLNSCDKCNDCDCDSIMEIVDSLLQRVNTLEAINASLRK
jgi:hypothetical protein